VEAQLLRSHLNHCIEDAIVSGDAAEQRKKAAELIELLGRRRGHRERRHHAAARRSDGAGARAPALASVMPNISQNLIFAFAYNSAGVPIAAGVLYPAFGLLLSPAIAAAAMALSSVSVIVNALRVRALRLETHGSRSSGIAPRPQ
jgi:hypothetical protein